MKYEVPQLEVLGDAAAIVLGKAEFREILDHVGPYEGEPDTRPLLNDPSFQFTTRPDA